MISLLNQIKTILNYKIAGHISIWTGKLLVRMLIAGLFRYVAADWLTLLDGLLKTVNFVLSL